MAGFKGGMGGMGNMQNLMKQAQKMQEQMQEADKELEELEVVGLSGGGEEGDETVVVYMNGKKIINGVEFGSKLSQVVDITDEDDVEMLEDLIMAAINDGYKKADEIYNEKMGPFGKNSGGLGGLI
ncbi:MAG: YbaB/EbfC family nucleoid-associated protein [Clostridia bacterium]|nr:YbaB/EbfC family nucleoid-associated protein [Clostridia bacterium]